jgi:hypothetical protein
VEEKEYYTMKSKSSVGANDHHKMMKKNIDL